MTLSELLAIFPTSLSLEEGIAVAQIYKLGVQRELENRLEEERAAAKNELARLKMEIRIRERRMKEDRYKFETDRKLFLDEIAETTVSTANVSQKRKRTDDSSDTLDQFVMNEKVQLLISEKEEMRKQLESVADKARNDTVFKLENVFENELQCGICRAMYVKAILLNCTHVFCQSCINAWKLHKMECPTCRTSITSESRAHVLDNVIDGVVA